MPLGLPSCVGKRDASADPAMLPTAQSPSQHRLGGGSWPRLRKQRTPEGVLDIWELSTARYACHDLSATPIFAARGSLDCLQLQTEPVQDAAAMGRHSDATAAPDNTLEHCSIPEGPVQGRPYGQQEHTIPEFAPSAQHAYMPCAGSVSAHDTLLADIALSQLEALAVEAMDQQEAHDVISTFTDACDDDILFSFLGGSHAHRSGHAVGSGYAAATQQTVSAGPCSSARMVNRLPTAASKPEPAPLHPLQLPMRAHGGAGSIASLPPRFSHQAPVHGLLVGASQSPPPRGDEIISVGGLPRPSAMAVERQLDSRLAGSRGSLERREWTAAEDLIIRSAVERFGTKWRRIADLLPMRSDDAVRNRWNRLKEAEAAGRDPPSPTSDSCGEDFSECSGSRPSPGMGSPHEPPDDGGGGKGEKKKTWTTEEDTFIVISVKAYGHKWNKIADGLPGRTDHAVRNRWQRLLKLEEESRNACPQPGRKGGGRAAFAPSPRAAPCAATSPPSSAPSPGYQASSPHLPPALAIAREVHSSAV